MAQSHQVVVYDCQYLAVGEELGDVEARLLIPNPDEEVPTIRDVGSTLLVQLVYLSASLLIIAELRKLGVKATSCS